MKLQLPSNKKLSKSQRMRLFEIDRPAIEEISEQTMHPQIAVTRLAVNAGLRVIAKQLGLTLPSEASNSSPKKPA